MTPQPSPISVSISSHAGLRILPPPADLADRLFGFVHRLDLDCGGVVRILPEVRASIQIMTADPYWVREQGDGAAWRRLDRVALWGPRHAWGWGYARRSIICFAVGLTPLGLAWLTGEAASERVNRAERLSDLAPALARALDVRDGEPFEAWTDRAAAILRDAFAARPRVDDPTAPSLPILAQEDGDAAARAAEACGLSPRQHRRVFHRLHGATPKAYQRLLRVDRMIRQLHDAPWEADAWSETPLPFADQPHAVREFRAATGLTPQAYRRAKRDGDATLRSVTLADAPAPPD